MSNTNKISIFVKHITTLIIKKIMIMKKILRLSLVAILSLICGTGFAQTTFDFDNDYATLFPSLPGTSSNDSHDGDFTEATTCSIDMLLLL